MILSAIAERLKRRSKDDFKGRHFEAPLILQAVCWYLRYPLSYRDIEELFREHGLAGGPRHLEPHARYQLHWTGVPVPIGRSEGAPVILHGSPRARPVIRSRSSSP